MEYILKRSSRKTLSIEVRGTDVIVRAPYYCPQKRIDRFAAQHEAWAAKKLAQNIENSRLAGLAGHLSDEEIKDLAKKAREYIPKRVDFYAKMMGISCGTVTIRCQRTKWGSCSAKGDLNFNCLLMLTPPEVIDSVVVHELCHRREMNHSERFYREVRKVFPEYDKWNKWLKDNGSSLINRMF